jgi:hypothetical protein
MENREVFSYQGKVALGIRNSNGSRGAARWAGSASVCELDMTEDQDELQESFSGQRGLYATLPTKKTVKVKLTLSELNDDNAALALGGQKVSVDAGTVTGEPIPAGKAGEMWALDFAKVSSVDLVGGAGGTTPLVLDTDYSLDLTMGVGTWLTDQATAASGDYEYAAHSIITALSGSRPEFYVLFNGINTVDGTNSRFRGEVYRVTFPPASTLALIQSSFGTLELEGTALVDAVRQPDPNFGPYARAILIDPDEA